jgi:hypothetical protein
MAAARSYCDAAGLVCVEGGNDVRVADLGRCHDLEFETNHGRRVFHRAGGENLVSAFLERAGAP